MGETDVIIGTSPPDPGEGKIRICRMPDCLISFDPKWRVKLTDEPAEAENLCPRCGSPLDRNAFIRRADDVEVPLRENDYEPG